MPAAAARTRGPLPVFAAKALVHLLAAPISAAVYLLVVAPFSRIRIALRRATGRKPAILWGPIPIINIRYSSRGERLCGYRSDTLVYSVYHINARDDFDYVLDRQYRVPVLGSLVPYGAFLWAGFRYDIFGCFFEGGLLAATPWWWLELPLLRLAGKKIVVYPYGPDARVASLTRGREKWNAYTDVPPAREDRKEAVVRRKLALFGRFANVMLGCADLVEHLPRLDGVFLFPFDTESWQPVDAPDDDVVTVVHGPNHRHYKGTRFVQEAVETLQAEGLAVELVLVEGLPTAEARRIYERADVVADQFLIGAYALLAIEAMALGKPVLCYLNPRFEPLHPEWAECPIVRADPDTLVDELRRLVVDPERRRSFGSRGPAYVRKYHSLASVGARMDAIYRELWWPERPQVGAAEPESTRRV
jgi:glycosyltransferase involved in cell wall biosynthesis